MFKLEQGDVRVVCKILFHTSFVFGIDINIGKICKVCLDVHFYNVFPYDHCSVLNSAASHTMGRCHHIPRIDQGTSASLS